MPDANFYTNIIFPDFLRNGNLRVKEELSVLELKSFLYSSHKISPAIYERPSLLVLFFLD